MALVESIILAILLLSFVFIFSRSNASPSGPPAVPLLGHLHLFMTRGTPFHIRLKQLSERYGPVLSLRFGAVPVFVASSRDAARAFLRTHDAVFASRPDSFINRLFALDADLINAPYGERWKQLRKLVVSELLTPRIVESYREKRMEEVRFLCASLRAGGPATVCMREKLHALSFNIITQMVMNERYYGGSECDTEEAATFLELMGKMFELAGEFPVSDYVPALRWLDPSQRRFKAVSRSLHEFGEAKIREHEAKVDGHIDRNSKCFLDILLTLLHDQGSEHKLDRTNVITLMLNMLLAGTDTSAVTLEWALAELIQHPDVMYRAQKEIEAVVGRNRLVEETDLPNLSYLHAVVKEVFRLHPVAPLLFPHKALETRNVMGVTIPAGATLVVNVYTVSRDKELWDPEPDIFKPERFLEDKANVDIKGQDFELLPFGAGRRMCPGWALGLNTVELALSNLLHAFDWEAPGGEGIDTVTEAFGLAMTMERPLRAVAKSRLPS